MSWLVFPIGPGASTGTPLERPTHAQCSRADEPSVEHVGPMCEEDDDIVDEAEQGDRGRLPKLQDN
jgi:hypothetical protein